MLLLFKSAKLSVVDQLIKELSLAPTFNICIRYFNIFNSKYGALLSVKDIYVHLINTLHNPHSASISGYR